LETNHDDSPATARDLIAWQLKRLRDRDGLSLRALADELTYSHTYLGDIETGRKIPTEPMARALDGRFDPPIRFTELLECVREMLVAAHVRDLLPKLRKAVRIQSFASSVIPGLLQSSTASNRPPPGGTSPSGCTRLTGGCTECREVA
jgi:transcriptional regulator with XRE-family HTH domain